MDKRELNATWALPLGYVLGYRFLSQLTWKLILGVGGAPAAWMQVGGIVVSIACALVIALACVYVHAKVIGPLPLGRAFLMAAIALPMLAIAHVLTSGLEGLTRYFTQMPIRAASGYAIVFLALPLVALMWRPPKSSGTDAPQDLETTTPESTLGRAILRVLVALISGAAFLGWGLMFLFIVGMGGFGTGRSNSGVVLTLGSPLVVFAICFLASVGLFRPAVLRVTRPAVVVGFLPFLFYLAINGTEGLLGAVAVLAFIALYWAMCLKMEATR